MTDTATTAASMSRTAIHPHKLPPIVSFAFTGDVDRLKRWCFMGKTAVSQALTEGWMKMAQQEAEGEGLNQFDSDIGMNAYIAAVIGASTCSPSFQEGFKPDYKEIIRTLAEQPLNINHQDKKAKFTALHYAIGRFPNLILAEALIKAGANVNIAGQHGVTALHTAAFAGNADGAKLLLKHGADPLRLTAEGDLAVELCATDEVGEVLAAATEAAEAATEATGEAEGEPSLSAAGGRHSDTAVSSDDV